MSRRQLKMGKMSDKMRQASPQMRKMRDVSSVLAPLERYGTVQLANSLASQGRGEGMGRGKPSPRIGGDWFRMVRSSLGKLSTRSEAKRLGGLLIQLHVFCIVLMQDETLYVVPPGALQGARRYGPLPKLLTKAKDMLGDIRGGLWPQSV